MNYDVKCPMCGQTVTWEEWIEHRDREHPTYRSDTRPVRRGYAPVFMPQKEKDDGRLD